MVTEEFTKEAIKRISDCRSWCNFFLGKTEVENIKSFAVKQEATQLLIDSIIKDFTGLKDMFNRIEEEDKKITERLEAKN